MQVTEDQKLLREKVHHLGGEAGIERMEFALSETRSKYFEAKENGSPVGSPITNFLTPSPSSSPAVPPSVASVDSRSDLTEGVERPSTVVRSLFKENTSSPKGIGFSAPGNSHKDGQLVSSVEKQPVTENELIVNEFVHNHRVFVDSSSITDDNQNSIKVSAVFCY